MIIFLGHRFVYFVGNLHAQTLNKAQTNQTNITSVQYFPGTWPCLCAHQQEWCQLCLIIYPLCITLTHYLC